MTQEYGKSFKRNYGITVRSKSIGFVNELSVAWSDLSFYTAYWVKSDSGLHVRKSDVSVVI